MAETNEIAIKVEHISKIFHAQAGAQTIKQTFVGLGKKLSGKNDKQSHKGDFTALNDINFTVKKGEFFGIVGRNGGGKSTLLKIIAGVYTPTKGAVTVNGKLTPFIELGVGFNPELSGRDNVYLNAALLGFTRKQTDAMYNDIVDFAELHDFMDTKLKNYSSGMQVRLAFSVAIRAESDILLIDEVLAVGDAAFQQKCYNYFEELKKLHKTVVFVTHDMGSVRRFCSKAVYISKGTMIHIGESSEIADIYTEDNIQREGVSEEEIDTEVSTKYRIDLSIEDQTVDNVSIKMKYKSKTDELLYVGLSVISDGRPIAELNSLGDNNLNISGEGSIFYDLDISNLNPGVYSVSAALFGYHDRNLLALGKVQPFFIIKGEDPSRGSALNLPNNWRKAKEGK